MEEIEIRLNDFLFNSGILGLYKILRHVEKDNLIKENGNVLILKKEALDNFEENYIKTMIDTYEEDTKWYSIITKKEYIKNMNFEEEQQRKKFDDDFKFIKNAIESNSYKAGYEILKAENVEENPYEYIKLIKEEKDYNKKREFTLKVIEHIEENKNIYCMKDIIYTKINCFWSNVSFLNRNANKNDIKQEYKKTFSEPAMLYANSNRKGDITCIECGNIINKKEASGMSWINDVGVDVNRKKSGFWNFNEDTYICPICNLIYSCIPLGFTLVGSNGIFINNNESIENLRGYNSNSKTNKNLEEDTFENIYGKILYNFINRTEQLSNENMCKYEPRNIQVIKRIGLKDNQKYEFNMIAKDRLQILKKCNNEFKNLIGTALYQEVLNNLIDGKKQYNTIYRLLRENKYIDLIKNILIIQLNSIGGIDVQDRKERIEEMIKEGEDMQKYFYFEKENQNKLKSYTYKLQGALKANSLDEFMKLFTLFYGSLGRPAPNCKAVKVLIEEPEYFRLMGYSYIYGLQKKLDKSEVLKGGNENEE